MDKNNFISLLSRYSRSTVSEALEVLALKQRYPYSQVLHALAAKVSKDHGFSTQQQELQSAAVYASDRAILKEIMLATHDEVPEFKPLEVSPPITEISSKQKVEIEVPANVSFDIASINTIDLAEIVIKDLKQLNKARHDFESMFTEGEPNAIGSEPVNKEQVDAIEKEKSIKSKRERIIELARAKAAETSEQVTDEKPAGSKKKAHPGEGLIDEIVLSKKEIDPETEEQRAQIQIIDKFIKAQPMINAKDKPPIAPNTDLSTIKSGEFGDNIISETLVDILIKQGKKDKAIEVLKKLIWKFPQKKAYFAAQIEELKK